MTEQAKEFIKKRYLSSEDEHRTKEQTDMVGYKFDKISEQKSNQNLYVNNQNQIENILSGQEGFPRREINTITSISRANHGLPLAP